MPDIRLRDYTAKIKELIRNVRLDEAIAHCQHILHHHPKYIEPYSLLGEACLEKEMYREAIEFFQRTLSADPENLIARVGLGIIYDQQGALPEAIWQLERAFELAPGNTEVRRELLRLYTQRDGSETARLRLTRGALGRLYSRNGLYERAVGEFHAVLRQDPDLPDIQVALGEALWRDGRRVEAVETCVELLTALPNCLKANLILGEIWLQGGNEEEGRQRLDVAHALDPENRIAHELMGPDSPLPLEEVFLPELEALPVKLALPAVDVWALTGEELPAQEMMPVEAAEAGEPAGELPDWLRDIGVEEEELVEGLPAEGPVVAEARPGETIPTDEMPEWLRAVMGEEAPPPAEESLTPSAPAAVEGEAAVEEAPPVLEIPEWLRQLERAETGEAAAPPVEAGVTAGVVLGGMAAIAATRGEEAEEELPVEEVPTEELEAPEAEEIPEWLQALVGAEILAETKEAVPFVAEEVVEAAPEPEYPSTAESAEAEAPAVAEWVPAAEEEVPFPEEALVVEEEIGLVEEMPAWLQELGVPEAEELAPMLMEKHLVQAEEVEAPAAEEWVPVVEEETSVPTEEVAFAEELPAWLRELETPAGEFAPPPVIGIVEEAVPEPGYPPAEVPASLLALVVAGLLDEADLQAAMTEMSAEDLEMQRTEAVPAWLQELIGEEVAPAAEAPAEEIPAWLRTQPEYPLGVPLEPELGVPGEEEVAPLAVEVPLEQVLPVEEAAVPVLEAVEQEMPRLVEEAAPPVEEILPPAVEIVAEAALPVEEILPPAVEVVAEAAPPVEEILPPAVEVVAEAAPPAVEEMAEAAPPVEEILPPAVEAVMEEEIAAPSRIDLLLEALKAQPRNQEARLELARLYSDEQNWNAALTQYEKLISARRLLPDVLGDLESLVEKDVDRARVYQLLGDVHMHQDHLDKALEMYRLARQWLTRH